MRHIFAGLLLSFWAIIIARTDAQALPIDPSQTVNTASGEMQFSLPLGSVDGVGGGGFPLNLTYTAGIKLHQSASPVGLGFSYGPGGITRKVIFE